MTRTAHIIGAGVSGLAAGVRLADAGLTVHVHEATQHLGGRCRSYFDGATGLIIDNGNHLVLSGNHDVLAYARRIGGEAGLRGPDKAEFPFVDLADDSRWLLRINDGRIPWWIFDRMRRVPGTTARDYLGLATLLRAGSDKTIGETISCDGVLYRRLVEPLLLAALNIAPPQGSAVLAGAIVRETLAVGGAACRPLIAREGLSSVLIEPAAAFIRARHGTVTTGRELRQLHMAEGRVAALVIGEEEIALAPGDVVVMAVPARSAAMLLPEVSVPTRFCAIVNAHFRYEGLHRAPPITGVVGGLIDWLFAFPRRLSVTISGADHLVDGPREDLARSIWAEVCKIAGIDAGAALPPWQIVRERRATFEATPAQNAMRPGPVTAWKNLFLAGDWTATGLPATIEGSVRSGDRAADLALRA
jgi:squalene-associated FAD-dependent desaturase